MANGMVVVDRVINRSTSIMVIIISILARSQWDVVAYCICLGVLVYCIVWREGCGRVVVISLFMYLPVFFMSLLVARYQEQPEILATSFICFEKNIHHPFSLIALFCLLPF